MIGFVNFKCPIKKIELAKLLKEIVNGAFRTLIFGMYKTGLTFYYCF